MRVFAYVFEAVLCGMGLLLSLYALASRNVEVHVGWLPWDARQQPEWILALCVCGLICVGAGMMRRFRVLLLLFSAAVLYLLARGLFLNSQYAFSTPASVRDGSLLVAGAFVAFLGSWPVFEEREGGKRAGYRSRH